MSLGIVARCDEGGLGVMTWEACRHLRPDVILAVLRTPHRGEQHLERLADLAPTVVVTDSPVTTKDHPAWKLLLDSVDTIYTAESVYLPELPLLAKFADVRLVVHVMPEYYHLGPEPNCEVWAPTAWLLDRLPEGTRVVPVPVDRERCAPRTVDEVRRVLYVHAATRDDRNGGQLFFRALTRCAERFDVVVAGQRGGLPRQRSVNIGLTERAQVRDYWRLYDDVDALVMPRRYGGLSLPMQEAASIGLPIVSLDLDPQRAWLHPELLVPPSGSRDTKMLGGAVRAWACDLHALTRTIDRVVRDGPSLVESTLAYAEAISWRRMAPVYRELLGQPQLPTT